MSYSAWGSDKIHVTQRPERTLLLNVPVYDTRLPWSKWLQPTLLLRLSTLLKRCGGEVKLFDFLLPPANSSRILRRRIALLDVDSIQVPKWRFGRSESEVDAFHQELINQDWIPDVVYVECGTTYWCEGAREVIAAVKKRFPHCHTVLCGTYPKVAEQHATTYSGADEVASCDWPELTNLPADLSLYAVRPAYHQILFGSGERTVNGIVEEINEAYRLNVRHFAFAEHRALFHNRELYTAVLEALSNRQPKVKLFALGSVSPADVIAEPGLPALMRQAGYKQICFADDRDASTAIDAHDEIIEQYRAASELFYETGFRRRTDEIIASACVGRSGEDLFERAQFITRASHVSGSVIVWCYQPSPDECGGIELHDQNGKIFPLRAQNQRQYRDYLHVQGLATVLNSKYRSCTFDFLGDGLMSQLFQRSVARQGWNPDPEVKGSVRLPMVKM